MENSERMVKMKKQFDKDIQSKETQVEAVVA